MPKTDEEELTQEEVEAKAEQDFSLGFKKVMEPEKLTSPTGDAEDEGTPEKEPEKELEEEEPKGEEIKAKEEDKSDEMIAEFREWKRKIDGTIGGLSDKVEIAFQQMKSDGKKGPTASEIQEAMIDKEAMDALIEEYKEFKPVADALEKIHSKIEQMEAHIAESDQPVDMTESVNEIREKLKLDIKYPDWEETINSDEFSTFMLEGGPSKEAYESYQKLENTNPERASEVLNDWMRDHPEWWVRKGINLFSDRSSDAIKLLDAYTEKATEQQKEKEEAEAAEKREKQNQKRLKGALTPNSSGAPDTKTGVTDEEAFQRGFNKVHRSSYFQQ